jgi:hypothetical protein
MDLSGIGSSACPLYNVSKVRVSDSIQKCVVEFGQGITFSFLHIQGGYPSTVS